MCVKFNTFYIAKSCLPFFAYKWILQRSFDGKAHASF